MSEPVVVEPKGIKEAKELLIGVNDVSCLLIKHLKDGVQVKDAIALFNDIMSNDVLKNEIIEAVKGISSVPGELKDLDASEIVEIASLQVSLVPKIIGSFKSGS